MTTQRAIEDGNPIEGFWKFRRHREAKWDLAIIWRHRESGEMVCRVGADANARMADASDTWLYCAKNKVTKAEATHYRETGVWPGDAPAPIGHNAPSTGDPFEDLTRELETERLRVEAWIAEPREGKTAADQSANWLSALRRLEKRVVEAFNKEKAPVLAEQQRIDAKWRNLKALAAQVKKAMDDCYQSIARKEQARLQAIADAKAKEEAEKRRREFEAEQARMAQLAKEHGVPAEPVEPPQLDLEPQPQPVRVSFGGAQGSRVGLRKKPATARVTDWEKVAAFYSGNPKVRELLQKLADHDARDGRPVDGMQIIPGE